MVISQSQTCTRLYIPPPFFFCGSYLKNPICILTCKGEKRPDSKGNAGCAVNNEVCFIVDSQFEAVNLKFCFKSNKEESFDSASAMLSSLDLGFKQDGRTLPRRYAYTMSCNCLFVYLRVASWPTSYWIKIRIIMFHREYFSAWQQYICFNIY
jgi:hypothetical protein